MSFIPLPPNVIPLPRNDPAARCVHCRSTAGLIEHDGGPVVCRSCVRALGELAADPNGTNQQALDVMMERHGDVVMLTKIGRPGRPTRLEWLWTGW